MSTASPVDDKEEGSTRERDAQAPRKSKSRRPRRGGKLRATRFVEARTLRGLGVALGAAALVLFCYLIPVTLVMHAFWDGQGQMQMTQFLKNLAIMGGLLLCFTSAPQSRFFRH